MDVLVRLISDPSWTSLLCATLASLLIYQFIVRDWNYFSERNVKFLREWPISSMLWQIVYARDQRRNLTQMMRTWYTAYPTERLVGFYEIGGRPMFVARDPDLIKRIAIKDAEHFVNHRFTIDVTCDPMIGRSLFFMKDDRWRQMRPTLSPLFTGHKMRIMFDIIDEKSRQFVEYVRSSNGGAAVELEMKDVFTRYATDVIATCAFGVEVNSLRHRSNEFYTMAKVVSNFEGLKGFALMLFVVWPRFAKLCRVSIVGEKYRRYFTDLVMGVVRHRRKEGIVREDIVNLLMKLSDELQRIDSGASQEDKISWTDDDLVAQCMGFFLAGYDPVSNLMAFMAHEITVNPHVQHRLLAEIRQSESCNGSSLTYTVLNELKYLDAVATECLRKWSPTPMTDRGVNKAYNVPMADGHVVRLQPGDVVTIPIHAIHMDPQYYEDPEQFRPERFLGGAKAEHIAAGTYLPFGIGARNCLGSRFALMEAKLVIYHLLAKFVLEKCTRTQDPLHLKPMSFSMLTERGIWMRLRPRGESD